SLVADIIQPFITFISGGTSETASSLVIPGTAIDFGAFISACINFLIIAIVVFCLIKALNGLKAASEKALGKEKAEEAAPRTCPFCFEEIHDEATRCPHCTAELAK
ncbi:MAG: MscL family protein, partial [Coriobacteriaceae bacterium]|nr:MscL family protein [Coriobacteriaceae bacterium]